MKTTMSELLRGTRPVWAEAEGGAGAGGEPPPPPSAEPPPAAEPPAAPPAEPPAGDPPIPPVEPPVAKPTDWRDGEIAKLRDQLVRERAKEPPKPLAAPEAPTDLDARVEARAQALRSAEDFTRSCEAAAKVGRETFTDFPARLGEITTKLVDYRDPASTARYNQFLRDTFEAADGDASVVAKIIYELGGDLNEANNIMNMSSAKRGAELARLSSREPSAVSGAPKPITPIGSHGEQHLSVKASDPTRADTLSTASWMERRNAEVAAKEAAEGGRGARR